MYLPITSCEHYSNIFLISYQYHESRCTTSWSTVSKDFLRSRKTTPFKRPLPIIRWSKTLDSVYKLIQARTRTKHTLDHAVIMVTERVNEREIFPLTTITRSYAQHIHELKRRKPIIRIGTMIILILLVI